MGESKTQTQGGFLCLLAAVVMAYGWGYRGITGHEGGAMVPGAMLGLAVCLASARADWHRRAAVAGLFGAVGWSWGGSFSYMEQTFYTVSDSFPDVLYGYAMLFFLGALWAGIGGAILGLAFTLPRTRLERLTLPFIAICAVFLLIHLWFMAFPEQERALLGLVTPLVPTSGEWFSASIVLVVGLVYALVRPRERAEALLFAACAAAWWVGYLMLVRFGGLALGPPYRSESWGGVLAILIVLMVYLVRQQNRAALLLCLYGTLGGGLAFAFAVFVRHPVRVQWGPFEAWQGIMQWKIAEETFGFFMGLAIALGVLRLVRGGLAPAEEDAPPTRLDVFSVFVVLVGMLWVNLRRAPERWMDRFELLPNTSIATLMPWTWFTLGGILLTAVALYALYLYAKGRLFVVPDQPYAKGALVLLLLLWIVAVGGFVQHLPGARSENFPLVDATFIFFAAVATVMLLSRYELATQPGEAVLAPVPYTDERWRPGKRYIALWAGVPVFLLVITGLSLALQSGPAAGSRLRFGPEAYWREAERVMGRWTVIGTAEAPGETAAPGIVPFSTMAFDRDRDVITTTPDGVTEKGAHGWHHADSVIWFDWQVSGPQTAEGKRIPMTLSEGRLYLPWPPAGEQTYYLVLERQDGTD